MKTDLEEAQRKRAGSMLLFAHIDEATGDLIAVSLSWFSIGSFYRSGGKWHNSLKNMQDALEASSSIIIDPKKSIEFLDKWDSEDSELNDELDYYKAPQSVYSDYFPDTRIPGQPAMTAASGEGCPPATQDIMINLENRKKAINNVGYGPMNPDRPNVDFWEAKADLWGTTPDEAKTSRCANCAMFVRTSRMLECIEAGLTQEENEEAWGSIDAGSLGYCEAFDFKCAAGRTCDAWVAGGPVTDKDEED